MSERRRLFFLRWVIVFLAGTPGACNREVTPERPAPRNILLITVDTLRADHLSSYGYRRRTSPVIDELAARGVRFDQAVVQWPKTGPSFASMFTATYPKDNQIVRRVGVPLPLSFRTVAEVLREQGYSTHAVVANGALAGELRYDQGFDTYVETWKLPGAGPQGKDNSASRVTGLAREAAAAIDRGRPFFFWVHYIDPHFPYAPPEPWRDLFQDDEPVDGGHEIRIHDRRRRRQMRGIRHDLVLEGRRDLAFYVARYDAEIAYVDSQIGELRDFLGAAGLLADTVTVVTSDHGESLGEHQYYFGHGFLGFEPGLRVPLVFHHPGALPPRVDPDPVELIHLAPTLLEMAGVPLAEGRWMQGRSLVRRLLGAAPAEDAPYAYSEAGEAVDRKWQRIVRGRRFKLIYAQAGAENRLARRRPSVRALRPPRRSGRDGRRGRPVPAGPAPAQAGAGRLVGPGGVRRTPGRRRGRRERRHGRRDSTAARSSRLFLTGLHLPSLCGTLLACGARVRLSTGVQRTGRMATEPARFDPNKQLDPEPPMSPATYRQKVQEEISLIPRRKPEDFSWGICPECRSSFAIHLSSHYPVFTGDGSEDYNDDALVFHLGCFGTPGNPCGHIYTRVTRVGDPIGPLKKFRRSNDPRSGR